MNVLHGYVVSGGPITRVRRKDGGFVNVLTDRDYSYGTNIVMLYDPMRDLVVGTHTQSEWAALQNGVNLDEEPPGEEEEIEENMDCGDLGCFSGTDF